MGRLDGRVAIVTGAGAGIGAEIARRYAEEGATVVAACRRTENGQEVVDGIVAKGGKAVLQRCDVGDEESVGHMVGAASMISGGIDILVNNAGVNFVKSFETLDASDWDRVISVDLRGTFLCTRAVIGYMLAAGHGSIINITSVHTIAGLAGAAPYDAAKWGIVGMTKSLAVEYARRNIRVNSIAPGLIATQIWRDILEAAASQDECEAYWAANIPMGRPGYAREVASVAAFLASEDASYITGANILVDGGMTAQLVSRESYVSTPITGTGRSS